MAATLSKNINKTVDANASVSLRSAVDRKLTLYNIVHVTHISDHCSCAACVACPTMQHTPLHEGDSAQMCASIAAPMCRPFARICSVALPTLIQKHLVWYTTGRVNRLLCSRTIGSRRPQRIEDRQAIIWSIVGVMMTSVQKHMRSKCPIVLCSIDHITSIACAIAVITLGTWIQSSGATDYKCE